jgi:hypothetical protein
MNINAREQGSDVGRWQPSADSVLPGSRFHSSVELGLRWDSSIQLVRLVTNASS